MEQQKLGNMECKTIMEYLKIGIFIDFSKDLESSHIKPILKSNDEILEELKPTDDIDTLKVYLLNIFINEYISS